MKPEEQQVKIAEACGFTKDPHAVANETAAFWRNPAGQLFFQDELPDYLSDLNAMHEAEKVLDTDINLIDDFDGFESARDRYMNKLQSITDRRPTHQDDCEWQFLTATAAQRAEAFLRTLNLWTES